MRIALSAGHNVYVGKYFDPGATNPPYVEADINKETVQILIELLKAQGHIVIDVTPYGERFADSKAHHVVRCNKVDEFKADLFLDIHINAGGGTGTEVWVYSKNSKAYPQAEKIANNISKSMNLFNRGVREKPGFWSVSLCKAPAMIVEGAFIDNSEDMMKLTPKKYAVAIAECFGEVKLEKPEESQTEKLYKVQVGAYRNRPNAEKLANELKGHGYNPIVVEESIREVKEEEKVIVDKVAKSKYYTTPDGLQIIETTKDNVYVATLPGTTLREFGIYGINGTWQNNSNVKDPKSIWGIAVNNQKTIGPNAYTNSPKLYKRGTIIYYADGKLEVTKVNRLDEIKKPVKWAIGGGQLIPEYNPEIEGYTVANNAADVLRVTAHTGIGYKGDKVFLIVHKNCSMEQFKNMILKLGLDGAIFLDGGGSTQMNYIGGKGISSTRKLSHGVFIKEV